MKAIKFLLVALIGLCLNAGANAQNPGLKTETITVSGNCGTCKSRIEKAAKAEGVSKAVWDQQSKVLTVTYDPAKTNLEVIGKKIAAVGHDNSKAKADDKVYNALPGCCKYKR
jgi:periplasmic mercuric ion binding protein